MSSHVWFHFLKCVGNIEIDLREGICTADIIIDLTLSAADQLP